MPLDRKSANEAYFDTLGAVSGCSSRSIFGDLPDCSCVCHVASQANATRPADLPPSQGGRYTGFGSTPAPSQHPSYGLSSASAPSLADIQADPLAALGKGWSFFSSAVASSARVVNDNVIQPGMEKVSDPNFRSGVASYVTNTTATANSWTKDRLGVDVGGYVSTIGATVGMSGQGGRPSTSGYQSVGQHGGAYDDDEDHHGESALYSDAANDDFFADFNENHRASGGPSSGTGGSVTGVGATVAAKTPAPKPKKDDWQEDEWKDF